MLDLNGKCLWSSPVCYYYTHVAKAMWFICYIFTSDLIKGGFAGGTADRGCITLPVRLLSKYANNKQGGKKQGKSNF